MAGNDVNTKSLLHFDGVNNGTVFTDDNFGGSAKTWTVSGGAVTSTEQIKFGTASGKFTDVDRYISTPNHSDWNPAGGDFTIELWVYPVSSAGLKAIVLKAIGGLSPYAIYRNGDANWQFYSATSDSGWDVASGLSIGAITLNAWQHIAVSRQGNTFRAFKNGALTGSTTSSLSVFTNPESVRIGRQSPGGVGGVYIDEFRFSNGIARYIANFTPPTAPFDTEELLPVTGAFSATESADTPASAGLVRWLGTFASTENADAFVSNGFAGTATLASLAATESADTSIIAGQVTGFFGTFAATEVKDTASTSGQVDWRAILAVTEAGDTATAAGLVRWLGTFASTENADVAVATGAVTVAGVIAAPEARDSAVLAAYSTHLGVIAAIDAADVANIGALASLGSQLAAIETGDNAIIYGYRSIINSLNAYEEPDRFNATAGEIRTSYITAKRTAAAITAKARQ